MISFLGILLNLLGLILCGFNIKSTKFTQDFGTFSDPKSGRMYIDLGWKFKVGFIAFLVGYLFQLYDAFMKL